MASGGAGWHAKPSLMSEKVAERLPIRVGGRTWKGPVLTVPLFSMTGSALVDNLDLSHADAPVTPSNTSTDTPR